MGKIARSPSYKCPEPVLILVGGAAEERSDARVYVFLSIGGRAAPCGAAADLTASAGRARRHRTLYPCEYKIPGMVPVTP